MCGIFLYTSKQPITDDKKQQLWNEFALTQHRGPEESILKQINPFLVIGFHRLCINDIKNGSQPFFNEDHTIICICNGEIYNYKQLINKYDLKCQSNSDCEVVLRLYEKFCTGSLEKMIALLDGVFSFAIVDTRLSDTNIIIGRDSIGVRSLYYSNKNDQLYITSELKSIPTDMQPYSRAFKPGTYSIINNFIEKSFRNNFVYQPDNIDGEIEIKTFTREEKTDIKTNIRALVESAVQKRLLSDRPIGCFLSGGLDSSIIAALVSKLSKQRIHTFSIGLKDSPDLKYASMVAKHINSKHHEVTVDEDYLLSLIPEVIQCIESWDTTTVLASIPMYLLAKHIKKNSIVKVLFTGEGIDEASGSYLYFNNAPSLKAFQNESLRLLRDLHRFDVLRCEKTVSRWGLEARVPFLDHDFLKYYMQLHPILKSPAHNNRIEKKLLRETFIDLLPDVIINRSKEAFSNGVSPVTNDWHTIVDNHCKDFSKSCFSTQVVALNIYDNCHEQPTTDKEYFFRWLFLKNYEQPSIIPYYWRPKWSATNDSSARQLDIYKKVQNESQI